MFYQSFRPVNCICNIFGLSKPHISNEGKSVPINLFIKCWCLIIAILFILNYSLSITITEFKLKYDLETVSDINDLVANVLIILTNLLYSTKVHINIHKTFDNIFNDFCFDSKILKLFVFKMFFWFAIPFVLFVISIIIEVFSKNAPYVLVIRIPIFLSTMHLFMHLYVILALLKVINTKLVKIQCHDGRLLKKEDIENTSSAKYVLSPAITFMGSNEYVHLDIQLLCKIYDNMSTSIHLLEKSHGFEILLSIWLMFTSGVVGMTLIVCNQATIKWLVIVKSLLPFFWSYIGCVIDEQLRSEVDQTKTLIIKCLIDYRCAPSTKASLDTFKELVSNDQLYFTACGLFNLSYAVLLGTVLNVLTYSIILIQMFLN